MQKYMRNRKKGKNMQKYIWMILLLAALLLLCACVPTPEEPVVIGKDQSAMVEKAQETAAPETTPAPVVEHVRETFSEHGVSVETDATVVIPQSEMPIVRVHGVDFSQETVDRFWDVLIGDTPMYPVAPETKEDLANRIEDLQRGIDELEERKASGESIDEEMLSDCREQLEDEKKRYATAPDDGTVLSIGPRLTVRDDGVTMLTALENPYGEWWKKDGKCFTVLNNKKSPYGKNKPLQFDATLSYRYVYSDEEYYEDALDREPVVDTDTVPDGFTLTMTPKEAMRKTADWIETLGVPFIPIRVTAVRSETKRQAYLVDCARTVNGVPLAVMDGYSRQEPENAIAVDWHYERFQVLIAEDGLLSLRWESPIEADETVVETSRLLPFDSVTEVFRKMMTIRYTSDFADRTEVFKISEIRLELVRVLEQNAQNSGLLIPVWCFYGTQKTDAPNWHDTETYGCQLMINAIDGSIIDAERGY